MKYMNNLHDMKFDKSMYAAGEEIELTAVYSGDKRINFAVVSYGTQEHHTKNYLFQSDAMRGDITIDGADQICRFRCVFCGQDKLEGKLILNYALVVCEDGTAEFFIKPDLRGRLDNLSKCAEKQKSGRTMRTACVMENAPILELV